MSPTKNWFEVDKDGLREIAKRRGMAFIVTEPIQNAWDEATTRVDVSLVPEPGVPKAALRVTDDSPDGFRDMADSYSMFRASYKLSDPEKRGRFNIGEKLLLAVADSARITSTKGSIIFGPNGRTTGRKKTDAGSVLEATLRMTRDELEEALAKARTLIPPVPTYVNGELVDVREPIRVRSYSLQTEVQGETGGFTTRYRTAEVRVFEPKEGEEPHLYEMGIPVTKIGVPFHVDVMQKIPGISLDRASVPYHYQLSIERIVAEMTADLLSEDEARSGWASTALGMMTDEEAIRTLVTRRFGEKVVTYDPANPESNKLALDAGYKVVHGGELTSFAWKKVKEAGALIPAGRLFDSGRIETSPDGVPPVPREDWTEEMEKVAEYAAEFAIETCDREVRVLFFRDAKLGFDAFCGISGTLAFNAAAPSIGSAIRTLDQKRIDEILIHECAHLSVSDHLTHAFHRECCRIGAAARAWEGRLR